MTAVLVTHRLSRSFAGKPIIEDFDLSMEPGQHRLLLGPSGSGKSTLINLVTGLLAPDTGEIRISGEAMTGQSPRARDDLRRRRIGIIFQTLRLVSALNVRANLRLAQKLSHGIIDEERIDHLLDSLGIGHRAHAKPRDLSQGEAQRAAIARALVGKPDLLVADEPTSALDHRNADRTAQLLLDTASEQGSTLLIATHDERLRAFFSDSLELAVPARGNV